MKENIQNKITGNALLLYAMGIKFIKYDFSPFKEKNSYIAASLESVMLHNPSITKQHIIHKKIIEYVRCDCQLIIVVLGSHLLICKYSLKSCQEQSSSKRGKHSGNSPVRVSA